MRVFLLADFANLDSGHKLNIIGAFNTIWVKNFPAVHSAIYLVAKIAADVVSGKGSHHIAKHPKITSRPTFVKHSGELPPAYVRMAVEVIEELLRVEKERRGEKRK